MAIGEVMFLAAIAWVKRGGRGGRRIFCDGYPFFGCWGGDVFLPIRGGASPPLPHPLAHVWWNRKICLTDTRISETFILSFL